MSQIDRTSTGLRDHLFSVLEALDDGDKTPQDAQAVAKLAGQINNSARIDQEYARFISQQRGGPLPFHGLNQTLVNEE